GDGRPRPSRRAKLAVFSFTMPMWGRLSNETASLRRNTDFSQIMPACLTHVGTAALGRPGGAQLAVFSFTMLTWGRLSNETASLRCNIDFSQIMPCYQAHVGTAALGRPGGAQLRCLNSTWHYHLYPTEALSPAAKRPQNAAQGASPG